MGASSSKIRLIFFISAIVLFQSCENAPGKNNELVIKIDNGLQTYVDRFYEEASIRGRNLEDESLIAEFTDKIEIQGVSFCGKGRHHVNGSQTSTIDIVLNDNCWENRSDNERENLVFHELGHALLGRFHFNELLSNGSHQSMMCGNCNNFLVYNEFQEYKRDYYLDELFIPDYNEVPDWSVLKTSETIIYEEDFEGKSLPFESLIDSTNIAFISLDTTGVIDGNSLFIESDPSNLENAVVFPISIDNQSPADCSDITLTLDIVTQINEGPPIRFTIAGYQTINDKQSLLQIDAINAAEDNSFYKEQVQLGCISEQINEIKIFLYIVPETKGQAYYDNLKVSILE